MPLSDKSLKIGLVLDDSLDKDDGVQQYVLSIGQWLRRSGHDVHYLVGSTKRSDIVNVHSLSRNMKVRFNGNRMSMPIPNSNKKLKALLHKEQFDILHVQMPYSPYLAHRIILNCAQNTAVIGTFHIVGNSVIVTHATKLLRMWTTRSLKRFDEIISVSNAAQKYALATFKRQSIILPNVIDYQRFNQVKATTQKDTNTLTILFLGRLVPRKGCMLLLEAINELYYHRQVPDFNVLICGKGPLLEKLQTYVAKHNLHDLVTFKGYIREVDKPSLFASSDISVFPSRGGESFGIVLLEAMASGRAAVLAGNNVGYRSVLGDRPDLLFDPFSMVELANKIERYLHDAQARNDAANWGKQYAKQFDTNVIGSELVKIYRTALRNRLSK